jgi:hypothetical protein
LILFCLKFLRILRRIIVLWHQEYSMADVAEIDPAPLSRGPLLITESDEEFIAICEALQAEIKPRDTIERLYVSDVANLVWEERRLLRGKTAIVNLAFRQALTAIITQLQRQPGALGMASLDPDAEHLASAWFVDPIVRKQVKDLLERFGLDESAIEAEAMRNSAGDLELLERLLHSAQIRRSKALVFIAEYRRDLGALLREACNKVIEGEVVRLPKQPQRSAA